MIPEREREALMRLTLCAREECFMCKYQGECNFDFQYELATKNMNILADALRKTEPTTEDCDYCKMTYKHWYEHCDTCKHKPKDEPTEREGE